MSSRAPMATRALAGRRSPANISGIGTGAAVVAAALFAAGTVAAFPASPYLPVVAVVAIVILALGIANPVAVTILGVLVIPLEGFNTFLIGPTQALMGAAAIGFAVRWVTASEVGIPRNAALAAFGALVLANVVGLLVADQPFIVLRQIVTWGALLVVALGIVQTREEGAVRNILLAVALAGAIAGLIAIVYPQALAGGGEAGNRATAGLGSPNVLGVLCMMSIPVQLVLTLRGRLETRVLGGICFALALAGLTLSESRGAFIGLAAALLVLALWTPFRWTAIGVGLLVLMLALVGTNVLTASDSGQRTVNRLTNVGNESQTNLRKQVWEATPQMIADHPVFGVGALEFGHAAENYKDLLTSEGYATHAHDTPLTIAAELGLIGLAAFVALVIATGAALVGVIRRSAGESRAFAFAIGAALFGFFAGGIVDYTLGAPPIGSVVFVLVGCAAALAVRTGRATAAEPVLRGARGEASAVPA